MLDRAIGVLTSLKLTVICLAFSMVLVFVGTLAQVDEGLYAAQERYFKSFFIYLETKTLWRIPIFPGGYLVGSILLINLLAAHAKRFQISRKKAGILMIHAGLILLLLGQLFTDILSRESALDFQEGQSKNYSQDFRKNELVLIDTSDAENDTIFSIPESRLRVGEKLDEAPLPFSIRVHDYWQNAEIVSKQSRGAIVTKANRGAAKDYAVLALPPVTEMDRRDLPAALIEFFSEENSEEKSLGTWLVSAILKPQTISHNDKEYELALRFKRYYEDFSLTLLDANHDNYKGTDIPKNFSSRVRIENAQTKEDREVLIYMNHPLRYEGLTFYQHQMSADEARMPAGVIPSSTLQVVRNPTWLTPYFACLLVGSGLLLQFVMHLTSFLKRQDKSSSTKKPRETKRKYIKG